MGDTAKRKENLRRTKKILSRLMLAVVGTVVLIALGINIYLATPLPAQQVSRILTSYLQQNITVKKVQISGATLHLKGVRLDNPSGFPQGSLAVADSITLAPQWGELLLGRQHFRLIELQGIRINFDKDVRGTWNFQHLQQVLAARKGPGTETRIKRFRVKEGAISIGGQGVQISLQVFNLATKGSLDSKIDLAFEDAARNRFFLVGKARAGSDPALDLTLAAPALSLRNVAASLRLPRPELLAGGVGSLRVNASFHKGDLTAAGKFAFDQLSLRGARKAYPLAGVLEFAAAYNLPKDAGRLQSCTLAIKDLVQLQARGGAWGWKKEGNFALEVGFDQVDLGVLNDFVPQELRGNVSLAGVLGCQALQLTGSASKGVTGASGTLQLHDGALAREGRLLAAGLSGTIELSRAEAGVLAKGRLSLSNPRGKPLLEALDMPFALSVSRQLKPLRARVPSLSARVLGIPFSGAFSFDASKQIPLSASLRVPAAKLSKVNSQLKRYGVTATGGSASVELSLAGSSLQELAGTGRVQVLDFQGSRGKYSFSVKNGSVAARLRRGGGHLQVQGDAQLKALTFNGKSADARFRYRIADRMVHLEDADLRMDGALVSIAQLSAVIAVGRSGRGAEGTSQPIDLQFGNAALKKGELEVGSLAGRLRGNLESDPAGRWLEGTAELSAGRVAWQGKSVVAPAAQVAFSRTGARADLKGELLGGTLAGSVSGNPFAPGKGGSFELRLKDARLAETVPFFPKTATMHPSAGTVEVLCSGGYTSRDGLSCRFESKGSGVGLTGAGGKKLLSGAGFTVTGTTAGGHLSIGNALLAPGAGVALRLKGELDQALSAQRTGTLDFSLPQTSLNSIVDPLLNLLPRIIQEATLGGTIAADGKVKLQAGKKLLDGSLLFQGGSLELAPQKLTVAGINGRFPFSLDFSGQKGGKPPGALNFSRENYPLLLEQLRSKAREGQLITISKIDLGALELGALTMQVGAGNGTTEITSLKTSLHEGVLLGKGFLTMREGLTYRGDLLINGVSLKQLCGVFPGIEGYISGRVDGVISVSGGAQGMAGLSGFTELWARSGSGEKMLVSKEFLQRLSKQKLSGFFFRSDRPYDQAEIKATLEGGDLTFQTLKIVHTNLLGVRDLNVTIAPTQNRIALDHLLDSIKQAAVRGKPTTGERTPAEAPVTPEFKWGE